MLRSLLSPIVTTRYRVLPTVTAGGRRYRLPDQIGEAARIWRHWGPTWKTRIIRDALTDRPGTVVDVGANWGQTMLDFLACDQPDARYLGVEPNVECAGFLQGMIAANQLEAGCQIVPAGLSTHPEVVDLHLVVGEGNMSSATTRADLRPSRATVHRKIACLPFDSFAPSDVSIVKIDVEGAELGVLQGMSSILRDQRPTIICEVLLADAHADIDAYTARIEDVAALLESFDYKIARIQKDAAGGLLGTAPVDSFPVEVWTPDRAEDCDYLFSPM